MIIAGICPKHGYWNGERCSQCNSEKKVETFTVPRLVITDEMKAKGYNYHAKYFPAEARILDKLYQRRKLGKPIDGNCFKEAGQATEELHREGIA